MKELVVEVSKNLAKSIYESENNFVKLSKYFVNSLE